MNRQKLPDNPNDFIDYSKSELKDIWLAGGCFWGVEAFMRRVPGVAKTSVGYANGKTERPTYEEVCRSGTGHAETVHVRYDSQRIALPDLLERFFSVIDPTSRNRQGNDVGTQYRTGIYYADPSEKESILAFVKNAQSRYERPIATEIEPLRQFFPAEEYHQSYLEKNPGGYCHISF